MNEPLAVRNKPAIKFVILMALALLALVVAAIKEPLQDMHWDVPIYLYQAKRFAETHYLANYARHAVEIVAQIQGGYPADEGYSESYWRFIRLGNIALIGVVVSLFGNTLAAISFLTWLYTLILVGGLAFCLSSVLMLGNSTDRTRPWFAGAAISALLFLLSDIYGYLAGNLVSKVLAIFLLSSAVVALLHSIRTRQRSWAMLSGLLAFVSYTARVESVWIWLTLLIAIAATRGSGGIRQAPWKPLLLAGLAAFLVFLVYAMIFHPLADPRNYLAFATAIAAKESGGVAGYQLIFVAGGLLWVGVFFSLLFIGRSGLVRLGWIWLVLCVMPWIPQIMLGGTFQARMMTLLITPLFLLSSFGWALLLDRSMRRPLFVAIAFSLCFLVVSQPLAYAWIHNIPGAWRIQHLRPFLYVPQYERLDYHPREMAALSNAIFDPLEPTVLIADSKVQQEYLNLIRYFGSSYHSAADLALVGDPTNRKVCDSSLPTQAEPVLFCTGYADRIPLQEHRTIGRLLVLRGPDTSALGGTETMIRTDHFALDVVK